MIKTRITKRLVDQAVATGGEHFVWDSDLVGFGLRVRPSGAKSYVVKYRAGTGRAERCPILQAQFSTIEIPPPRNNITIAPPV